jgi:hypothetical protein
MSQKSVGSGRQSERMSVEGVRLADGTVARLHTSCKGAAIVNDRPVGTCPSGDGPGIYGSARR